MSATQFYVNETAHTQFVGGRMIPPGEGRDVPLMYLPATHRPEPEAPVLHTEPSLDELLADLLRLGVKNIVVQLPGLTNEAIDRLEALEREATAPAVPRKTLLEAVGAERLKRAAATFQDELDAQHAAQLATLSPEEREAVEGPALTDAAALLPNLPTDGATTTPEGQG
jgi:hypothetical protein